MSIAREYTTMLRARAARDAAQAAQNAAQDGDRVARGGEGGPARPDAAERKWRIRQHTQERP